MDKLPLKLLGDNPVTHPGQDRLGFLRFVEPFADRILASRAHAPVTVAQFRPFVEQDGYSDADYWTRDGWSWRQEEKRTQPDLWDDADHALDNHPVVGVTWYEAVAWCNWLTARLRQQGVLPEGMLIRLPTEAEWEWAARGSEGLCWPWGEDWPEDKVLCNSKEAGLGAASAVGLFLPGRCA